MGQLYVVFSCGEAGFVGGIILKEELLVSKKKKAELKLTKVLQQCLYSLFFERAIGKRVTDGGTELNVSPYSLAFVVGNIL